MLGYMLLAFYKLFALDFIGVPFHKCQHSSATISICMHWHHNERQIYHFNSGCDYHVGFNSVFDGLDRRSHTCSHGHILCSPQSFWEFSNN